VSATLLFCLFAVIRPGFSQSVTEFNADSTLRFVGDTTPDGRKTGIWKTLTRTTTWCRWENTRKEKKMEYGWRTTSLGKWIWKSNLKTDKPMAFSKNTIQMAVG